MVSFTHLRTASGLSLRYGASQVEDLAERAGERGLDALALTDRDTMAGSVRHAKACAAAGVRPLFGVDLSVPPAIVTEPAGTGRRRSPVKGGAFVAEAEQRAVMLARTARGWATLCRLTSAATESKVGWADLDQAAGEEDLIVLLGADSEVGAALAQGRPDKAARLLVPWRDRFGTALRLEAVCHGRPGTGPGSLRGAARMVAFADEHGIPAVLSNAVRYADPGRAEVADLLDSARLLVPIDAREPHRLDSGERWLKDTSDMERIAERVAEATGERPGRASGLLAQTEETAASCEVDPADAFGLGRLHLPEAHLIGADESSVDRELAGRCAAAMLQHGYHRRPAYWDRLESELTTVSHLGLAGYFLTIAEVVRLAKELGVRVAARGSAVGSLVVHLLGISPIDAVAHGLVLERFLSPRRAALPDIDLDVESARRLDVYQAVRQRFGSERVATLAVYETYRARGAIRCVALARGLAPAEADRLAEAFPQVRARDVRSALRELPELKRIAAEDHGRLWSLVEALDGLPHSTGMHPCGLLVSDAGLLERTPVTPTSIPNIDMSVFSKHDIEDTGHIKVDIIGVRAQSALAHTVAEITRTSGRQIDLDDPAQVPPEDSATLDLVHAGGGLATYQLESPGQRELVRKLRPCTVDDFALDVALFRPGPVAANMIDPLIAARDGRTAVRVLHRDLEPILAETHGQVVYHEQVIKIIARFTQCDLGLADEARRALSDPDRAGRVRAWFTDAARLGGYDRRTVTTTWDVLAAFGSYGFCKGHALALAVPAYQSAWAKTHHPAAFFAGALTHDPGMYPRRVLAAEARRRGVPLLTPDIEHSQHASIVEQHHQTAGVRLGLGLVKGITTAETDRIINARPYRSLDDFWQRARPSLPVAERLARIGALDPLGPRRELLLHLTELHRQHRGRSAAGGQLPLTAEDPTGQLETVEQVQPAGLPDLNSNDQLAAELEVLGMDVSRHLLDDHRPLLAELGATPAARLPHLRHGQRVLVAGVKASSQTPPTRSGKRTIFLTLDDPTELSDLAYFEDTHDTCAETIFHSSLLLARGTVSRRHPRSLSITGQAVWDLAELIDLYRDGGADAVADRLTRPGTLADTAARTQRARRPGGRSLHHASPGSAG
ncbi:error-prone DNA polymerase [Streptomyces sp. KhCrAH-43]|uniref:DNA polymerase III subunit alpha n=1 Tax=unclassified Streptomyces TaxID=2593676 RepID=UPI00036E2A11|nr:MULTISPECIES: DNA polymerase III subunit alpha [unclassified Streptomyces]MYS33638.1 DNA polymerase III subunit alpha [Streptomyces sp. SID4920]MYX63769.1 DNA polymerase III subunit alpha [Streptomyces sp. SID8373]RAJ52879.1 error-prone DNA polymerase [Streptomyces sp. KhCrAH-43]